MDYRRDTRAKATDVARLRDSSAPRVGVLDIRNTVSKYGIYCCLECNVTSVLDANQNAYSNNNIITNETLPRREHAKKKVLKNRVGTFPRAGAAVDAAAKLLYYIVFYGGGLEKT